MFIYPKMARHRLCNPRPCVFPGQKKDTTTKHQTKFMGRHKSPCRKHMVSFPLKKLRWYPQQLGAEGLGFVCSLRLRLQRPLSFQLLGKKERQPFRRRSQVAGRRSLLLTEARGSGLALVPRVPAVDSLSVRFGRRYFFRNQIRFPGVFVFPQKPDSHSPGCLVVFRKRRIPGKNGEVTPRRVGFCHSF